MTSSLHRQLVLTVDRIALKLAKRTLALLDSGDDADLAKAIELFQALARWAAERGPSDGTVAPALGGTGARRRAPTGAAARLAGLIAELPTSAEPPARPRDGSARGAEPTA